MNENLPEAEAVAAESAEGSESKSVTERRGKQENPGALGSVVSAFVDHIDSLRLTLYTSMMMTEAGADGALEEFREFAKKHGKGFVETAGKFEASFAQAHARHAERLVRKVKRARDGIELVPRSFVVALVSECDAFLGRLIKTLFLRRPELLDGIEQKSLAVADLLRFQSLEEAKDSLLEKEIENVLRKSHSDQFAWLESRFGVPLRKDLPAYKTFIELTERRNLFVHCDGVVSQQYLTSCRHHEIELSPDAIVGTQLRVTRRYFEEVHACVYEIGVKLAHVLWRKLLPAELEAADVDLNGYIYDLLVERRYQLAAKLLDFACNTLKKPGSEEARRIFVINRAQAYKWLKNQPECERILAAEDWSACGEQFRLCVSVLRDDYNEACKWMHRIGSKGSMREADYEDWPLFREFRESEQFLQAYREVFGGEFSHIERTLKVERESRFRELQARIRRAWPEGEGGEDSETRSDGESDAAN